jgi:diketogulonate reductase-like aldo/keto reductase
VRRRNARRTVENQLAGEVELSAEELAEIAQLLEKYPRKGARYYVDVPDELLNLWN